MLRLWTAYQSRINQDEEGASMVEYALLVALIAVIAGLSAKTVDGASAFSYPLIFLPFISSAFVPTDSMPGPVAWFAENQPVTAIVDTLRALFAEEPVGGDIWIDLASFRNEWRCLAWTPERSECVGSRHRGPAMPVVTRKSGAPWTPLSTIDSWLLAQRVGHLVELAADVAAEDCDRHDGDDCDECDEQSVLHHARTLFLVHEPALEGRPKTKHVLPPSGMIH